MKVLVTGGAGFIGSHFVKRVIREGHTVVDVDKLTYAGNLDNLEDYKEGPRHIFYQTDICEGKKIEAIFAKEQPDCVVHMAAETHVDRSIDSGDAFLQTNVVGTYTLLKAAHAYYTQLSDLRRERFRFLHLSTDEVFGSLGPTEEKFSETTAYKPNSPYSAAKASSDLFVRAYYHTYQLPILIVNTTNNYGPFQFPEKLIPVVILNALDQKPLPIYGDGQQIRDWLFVEDHVEALLTLLTRGVIGETYCVGGGNEWTNLNIVREICTLLDQLKPSKSGYKDLITFVQDRPGHDRRYAIDSSKLQSVVGWRPKHSIQKGLQETIVWYIQNAHRLQALFVRHRLGLQKH